MSSCKPKLSLEEKELDIENQNLSETESEKIDKDLEQSEN